MCATYRYLGLVTIAVVGALVLLVVLARPNVPLLREGVSVRLRGHQEIAVLPEGELLPVVFEGPVGLCLDVPTSVDSSQWHMELRFSGAPSPSGTVPPTARSGTVLCFDVELPQDLEPQADHQVCGMVVDRFDGSKVRVPCRPIHYDPGNAAYSEATAQLGMLLAGHTDLDLPTLLNRLDHLAAEAREAGFVLLAVRIALIAVHYQGFAESDASGMMGQRLDELPDWIDRPETGVWGAMVAQQRALLAMRTPGQHLFGWQQLAEADVRYRMIADPRRLLVVLDQAERIVTAGAVREGARRLRTALADCAHVPCSDQLIPYAEGQLAWYSLIDPLARDEELAQAERYLAKSVEAMASSGDVLEQANTLINLAYLRTRTGSDVATPLQRARSLLAQVDSGGSRRSYLLSWIHLIEGLAELYSNHPAAARAHCEPLVAGEPRLDLAAHALSCMGRAERQLGQLRSARRSFATALTLHRHATSVDSEQRYPLGPSLVAEDSYRAALVEIELGQHAAAWQLLADLDRLGVFLEERRRCREAASDLTTISRWEAIDDEIASVLEQLVGLDEPVSGERRRQLAPVSRNLRQLLQELTREWPGCHDRLLASDQLLDVDFRAFAVDDEVVLLHRRGDGAVNLVRRTEFPRVHLLESTDQVAAALEARTGDTQSWRELTSELAAALVPEPGLVHGVVTYALHGVLQRLPLASFPLGTGWVADHATIAHLPAGVRSRPESDGSSNARPVFVIDPEENLPSSHAMRTIVREWFPGALVLAGENATRDAVRRALHDASWLHVGAHGAYDPAFAELSHLRLSDGPMTLLDLSAAPAPHQFANLSGCRTGSWPVTAGRGHFGIAGALARQSVGWVVAVRTELADRLAFEFDAAFYAAVGEGRSVPEAYAEALARIRSRHPPSVWLPLCCSRAGGEPWVW